MNADRTMWAITAPVVLAVLALAGLGWPAAWGGLVAVWLFLAAWEAADPPPPGPHPGGPG